MDLRRAEPGNRDRGVEVPSINIHTNQNAENPSVAGGSAVDPTKPGPWITWQETDTAPVSGRDQIFTVRPIGPASTNCDGVKPAGVAVAGHVPAIGGFCWQQTGIPRAGANNADPSMNVDPTRNGVEPDIAFTGSNDSVPWVVWYETGRTTLSGLHANEMVFAAKGVSDGVTANGGFHWVAVGNALQATLDTTGTTHFGNCVASATTESQCSLNSNPAADAEDPQVAAGTMNRGQSDCAVGDLGRKGRKRHADLRLPAGRWCLGSLRDRQRRQADLVEGRERDSSRHHVLA